MLNPKNSDINADFETKSIPEGGIGMRKKLCIGPKHASRLHACVLAAGRIVYIGSFIIHCLKS